MRNFSTNQVRHFFVAGAIDSNVDTNLDIYLGTAETGELYLKYKNADGLLTRSVTFDPKKIRCINKQAAADLATKLMAHTIAIDTNVVTLANLVGKTLVGKVDILGAYDGSNSPQLSFNAIVVGDATNTANATAFHKALAYAIAQALPITDPKYPWLKVFSNGTEVTPHTALADITGSASGVVLVEAAQKYVRGKLTGDPCHFNVSFQLQDGNLADVVWGTDTVAASAITNNTVVPINWKLADLEDFAQGERGDYYRGYAYPNDYNPAKAIDPFSDTAYYMLTVECYWNGTVSDVQKSPMTIQVAGPQAVINSLYIAIEAAMNGNGSASGSGA